jgi:hypothetical protein
MVAFERFLVDWRDLGVVPRRLNPPWLPPASGAFLTWLTYRHRPLPRFPNDVDLVVNANVLYALARYGRLGVPGADQAVALINLATALGLHRGRLEEITAYYPDNLAFGYAVSRAFFEGPVPALEPSVRILADDLEASVRFRPDGTAYWDKGEPHLNTAFAVLTLLNARRETPIARWPILPPSRVRSAVSTRRRSSSDATTAARCSTSRRRRSPPRWCWRRWHGPRWRRPSRHRFRLAPRRAARRDRVQFVRSSMTSCAAVMSAAPSAALSLPVRTSAATW